MSGSGIKFGQKNFNLILRNALYMKNSFSEVSGLLTNQQKRVVC
jgi:hypothetical protein